MNSYKNQNNIKCCANCKYSFMRIGTTLHCNNRNEWLKESAVQHIGICNSFEFAIDKGMASLYGSDEYSAKKAKNTSKKTC